MHLLLKAAAGDYEPLDPQMLKREFDAKGWPTEDWLGKANAFHYLTGTIPSYGYFLFPGNNLPSGSVSVEVGSIDDTIITIEGLVVEQAVAITPEYEQANAFYLVTVIDPVIKEFEYTFTNENYNIPVSF